MDDRKQPSVEETLARLGIEEVEERLEVSPIFGGGEVQEANLDGHTFNCCNCKTPPTFPDPHNGFPPPPGAGG